MRPPDTVSDSEILPGPLSHLSSCMLMTTFYLSSCMLMTTFSHRKSVGLSGRTLRKIPFLAHALYIHVCLHKYNPPHSLSFPLSIRPSQQVWSVICQLWRRQWLNSSEREENSQSLNQQLALIFPFTNMKSTKVQNPRRVESCT